MREPPESLLDLVKRHENKIRIWEPKHLRQIMHHRGWFRVERWDGERVHEVSTDFEHSADHPGFRKGNGILYTGDESVVSFTQRATGGMAGSESSSPPSEKQKFVNKKVFKRKLSPALQKIKDRAAKT